MKFCGPKLSLCGIIISIWGIIQLVSFSLRFICLYSNCDIFKQVLMGFFYYIRSVALIEDLNIGEDHIFKNSQEFYSTADKMYSLVIATTLTFFHSDIFFIAFLLVYPVRGTLLIYFLQYLYSFLNHFFLV
jgi:hypothetical protein